MNKPIDTTIPLSEINHQTVGEHTSALGHPANLHMWWGRTPRTSTLEAMRLSAAEVPNDLPTVFDPFCGYGGIPMAAQELSLPVIAGDLNPVAVMLTIAASDIPARFANRIAVHPGAKDTAFKGTDGLAEDLRYYGNWMREKAREKLANVYPAYDGTVPTAWIWARTIECPNPACRCRIPMMTSSILSISGNSETWTEPTVKDGKIRFELRTGKCPVTKRTNKFKSGSAQFACPVCGELTTDAYVKQEGLAHRLGAQLMAVFFSDKKERYFKPATPEQEAAADLPMPEDVPQGAIPVNAHWFGPPGFGLTEFSDLFSPRQLTMLTTFSDLVQEVQFKAASDALAAGFQGTGGSLADGGTGALAYGEAISVYLAFAVDKLADANTTVCSWRTAGSGLRNTFGRQSIPMVWNYGEGNPFSNITGNFDGILKNIIAAVKQLPCGSKVTVHQGNAVTADFPKDVLVCTELPYYRTLGYAHLSDFFYIWMRRSLKGIFPKLFEAMLTPKDELSTVNQYYGVPAEESVKAYREQMKIVLEKLYLCSRIDVPVLLFYEYRKADELCITSGMEEWSAWDHMLQAMADIGFTITAVWPTRSEPADDRADSTRVLIVARTTDKTEQTTRRGFINTLKRELPEKLATAYSGGVDDVDRWLVGMGCGLSVFTANKRVLNADGSNMSVHDALLIIYQEVESYRLTIKEKELAKTEED